VRALVWVRRATVLHSAVPGVGAGRVLHRDSGAARESDPDPWL